MPSPFPGMDPYLEHPDMFPDFHNRFVMHLSEFIQSALPEPYIAGTGRRTWVETSERYIEPDIEVLMQLRKDYPPRAAQQTAVLETETDARVVIHVTHDESEEPYIEIYIGRGRDRRLVTSIQLLSMINKTPGELGRGLYRHKQRELLYSKAHFIEIDLLRGGMHSTGIPGRQLRRRVPQFDYHVCLHRFDNLEDFFVYPIRLQDRLPSIEIPLLPDDGSIEVDLQAVFNRCYDAGPYSREIDYQKDRPDPPFTEEQQAWANELLGIRPRNS